MNWNYEKPLNLFLKLKGFSSLNGFFHSSIFDGFKFLLIFVKVKPIKSSNRQTTVRNIPNHMNKIYLVVFTDPFYSIILFSMLMVKLFSSIHSNVKYT